jgi:hypothetical protein
MSIGPILEVLLLAAWFAASAAFAAWIVAAWRNARRPERPRGSDRAI